MTQQMRDREDKISYYFSNVKPLHRLIDSSIINVFSPVGDVDDVGGVDDEDIKVISWP